MAIEPFRRRIGISSPGSLLSGNAPQIADVGPSISRAAGQIFDAAQPALRTKAVKQAQADAGKVEIVRDEQGRALPINTPEGAGLLYQQAFDEIAQARYVSQVSLDFQTRADAELEAMRSGKDGKRLDAEAYRAFIVGAAQGVLEVADPRVRPTIEATLAREGLERTRAVYNEVGQRTRQDQIAGLNTDLQRYNQEIAKAAAAGAPPERLAQLQADAKALIDSVQKVGAIGPRVAEALGANVDVEVQDAVAFAGSMTIANQVTPPILGLSFEALQTVERWMTGVNVGDVGVKVPGLNFGDISTLHPKAKQALQTSITDRKQQLATQASEANARARELRNAAREEANTRRIENVFYAAQNEGYQGNYNAETQKYLTEKFMKTIGFKGLESPNGSQALLGFIGQTQFVPKEVVSWMDNRIRSSDPMAAVNLFSSVSKARVNGAAVGDLMLARMDSRSAALFRRATMALEMGTPPSDVLTLLDKTRTSTGFTFDEARGSYNRGSSKTRGFDVDLDSKAPSYFGLPKGSTVPSNIRSRVNQAFVDNLDLHPGNPEAALDAALGQVAPLYTRSSVFRNGIGPAVLTRVATNQKLADLVSNLTIQGKPFLTAAPGGKKHTVGPGGNIKFVPADDDVADVGAYRIEVYDPTNPSRLMLPVLPIDLGAALALRGEEKAGTRGAPLTPPVSRPLTQAEKDKIAFERRNREPLWVK